MLITTDKTTDQKTLSLSEAPRNTKKSTITTVTQPISSITPLNHILFWGSSYDRGIDILLKLWPKVLDKFPDATLHCCYGWELFDKGYANNPERMAWKEKINKLMEQKGIVHHGRVSKSELEAIRKKCGIWAYPTYFGETCCITALDCQKDGVVPVTMDYAGLSETVQSGIKVKGDIYDPEVREEYLQALLGMMGDEKIWWEEKEKGIEFAQEWTWDNVAKKWEEYL